MKKLYTYILLSAFLSGGYLFAQDRPALLLNSGVYQLNESLTDEALKPGDGEAMTLLRVVQFERPLLQEERMWLENHIGEILHYLPENAYLMLLPDDLSTESFGSLPLFAISPLSAEMKMTRRLAELNLPEYVYRGGNRIEIIAGITPNSNPEILAINLELSGFVVKEVNRIHRTLTLEIDQDERHELASWPAITFVQPGEAPAEPENFNATRSARSTSIKTRITGGRNWDGTGVTVGHGDDGDIDTHLDFHGRVIAKFTGPSLGDHGDHVAGTLFGAGNLNPRVEGMAPGADMVYYSYPRNLDSVDLAYNTYSVRVTNSSYSNGCNAGYTAFSARMDEDIIQNPKLMHVFSAGNDGTSNCNYGAGGGWGNITGGHKVGKNVIATANVTFDDNISISSSRGPAADGRLKPDVSSVGTAVYSTLEGNNYGNKSGTSMSSPGAAGSIAQLFQAFETSHGSEPDGGLLKAFMMNTADDLGNKGPDFIYGYGRINNLRASRDIESGRFITDQVATGQTDSFQLNVPPGTAQLRVMVYWTDPAASPSAGRVLVNDLDATLRTSSGNVVLPYVLDPRPNPVFLNENAVRAVDSLNNAEQMIIDNPAQGAVWVRIQGTNVPLGPQKYYVVYSMIEDKVELTYPFGGEALISGESTRIYWDASAGTSTFNLEYTNDGGSTWSSIGTAAASSRQFNWTVPNLVTDSMQLRITRGTQTDLVNAPLVVAETPNRLRTVSVCPDSFTLAWDRVLEAEEYEIYILGNKYMDSVTRTVDTFYTFVGQYAPTLDLWYSVAAVPSAGGLPGVRANAVRRPSGISNCIVADDLSTLEVISPQSGYIPACHNLNSVPVIVRFINSGLSDYDSVPVTYEVNGTLYRDTIFQTLASGNSITYTFGSTFNAASGGLYSFRVWGEYEDDLNGYNDTIAFDFQVGQSAVSQLPFNESFDSWSRCGTGNDCGATVCSLRNGWVNYSNGVFDDIDWRTNFGSTSSNGTGPGNDHTQGTVAGSYLYLEASGGCNFQWAEAITPCIDLTSATAPEMSFWYHMFGPDIGELHVDVFSDGQWYPDVITPLAGPQSNSWQQVTLSMVPWTGKTVSLRFRGSTGGDYQGDIAIDDVSIQESQVAPVAGFAIDKPVACIGETVTLQDKSTNVPSTWLWTITPSSFNFVNGTNANSQNPQVEFTALGTYSIKLVATNPFGADSVTLLSSINIGNGYTPAYVQDFEQGFVPGSWLISNPDQLTTWESHSCVGSDGNSTNAARINNHGYSSPGQEDGLITPSIDLMASVSPRLIFDRSYSGTFSNKNDRLRIDISTDCGDTWLPSSYSKTGTDLVSSGPTNSVFEPFLASQWERDTLDLTPYAGMSIKVRFVNITDNGNALYIDNVQFYDLNVPAPTASFTSNLQDTCIAQAATFTFNGSNATDIFWDFGNGANPQSANGPGPHVINYGYKGAKTVSMTAQNAGGQSQTSTTFNVEELATANFGYVIDPVDRFHVQFVNSSTGTIDSYFWDFNDNGATSNLTSPSHIFSTGGDIDVTLIVTNRCGPDTITQLIRSVSLPEDVPDDWILAPNPASTELTLYTKSGALNVTDLSVIDIHGRELLRKNVPSDQSSIVLNVNTLPSGVYFIKLISDGRLYSVRFAVSK